MSKQDKRSKRKHLKQLKRNAKKKKLRIEGIELLLREKKKATNNVEAE